MDTSVIIKWLKEKYSCEIIAFAADVGQGQELDPVREKALSTGASKVYIEDLREEFVSDFVFPMLRANAFYEHNYLLGTSIARPLIAKEQIRIAKKEKADGVSHGSTGKGNDQVRFELAYHTLSPDITIVAPWREWDLNSRTALLDYAKDHEIPVPVTKAKPYSMDRNIFHVSYEGGNLEDPWVNPDDDMFLLSVSPENAPDKPTVIQIQYEAGNPIAVNGEKLSPAKLMESLNQYGGKNGIGRIDIVENRFVGMKSRGIYETPGGTILAKAHRAIESITLDRGEAHLKDEIMPKYAQTIYNGLWFSSERQAMQRMIDETQKNVTGDVKLKLYKGNVMVQGRRSPNSRYNKSLVSFDQEGDYDQKDAEGFIKINSLRLKNFIKK